MSEKEVLENVNRKIDDFIWVYEFILEDINSKIEFQNEYSFAVDDKCLIEKGLYSKFLERLKEIKEIFNKD